MIARLEVIIAKSASRLSHIYMLSFMPELFSNLISISSNGLSPI
jgi:hypothetical protein